MATFTIHHYSRKSTVSCKVQKYSTYIVYKIIYLNAMLLDKDLQVGVAQGTASTHQADGVQGVFPNPGREAPAPLGEGLRP